MKKLALSGERGNGKHSLVDDTTHEVAQNHTWWINAYGYVVTNIGRSNVLLHHIVVGRPINGMDVDHINGDKLDNRAENLRIISRQQNSQKMIGKYNYKNKSSKYKGVCFDKSRNKWIAGIKLNYKRINLGRFDNEIDAAVAYNVAAERYFGEFANPNKITGQEMARVMR